MKNQVDFLRPNERRLRRSISPEVLDESKEFSIYDRQMSISMLRDLQRNYAQAKTIINQLAAHVVGTGVKAIFHSEDKEWASAATKYFNGIWQKNCDARDNLHFADLADLALSTIIREHDCICFFDTFGDIDIEQAGKLYFWEGSQCCDVSDFEFRKDEIAAILGTQYDISQENGVIKNEFGRTLGWIVTSKQGQSQVDYDDCSIIKSGPGVMLKKPWRLNSSRGFSDLVASAGMLVDCVEMMKHELISAKNAAAKSVVVTTEDPNAHLDAKRVAANGGDVDVAADDNCEILEEIYSGALEYLKVGEDVKILDNPRPNQALPDFLDFAATQAGAGAGLTSVYSLMKANNSYSSARAEMNIADVTFKRWQKFLERYFFDWAAEKAVEFGYITGSLSNPKNDFEISWQMEQQKPIDETKKEKADAQGLENGTKTLSSLLGPEWMKITAQRLKEKKFILMLSERLELPVEEEMKANGIDVDELTSEVTRAIEEN